MTVSIVSFSISRRRMWYTGSENRVYCYANKEFVIMGCNHGETSCLRGE